MFAFSIYIAKQLVWFVLPMLLVFLAYKKGYLKKVTCRVLLVGLFMCALIFFIPSSMLFLIPVGGLALIGYWMTKLTNFAAQCIVGFFGILAIPVVLFIVGFNFGFERLLTYDEIEVRGQRYTVVTDLWWRNTLLQRQSVENKFLYKGNQVFVPQQQKLGDVIVDDPSFDSDGTPESSYYDSDEEYFDVVWQGKKLNSN